MLASSATESEMEPTSIAGRAGAAAGRAEGLSAGAGDPAVLPLPAGGSRVDYPPAVRPLAIEWSYVIVIGGLHLLCFAALLPWLFSWSGVALAVVGHFTFGMLGICVGYHRLLTHRGFTCPRWLEHSLAVLGMCTLQESPARWVAIHRLHHQHSDHEPDPHTPLAGFFWAHFGWLMVRSRDHHHVNNYERYVRDLLRDPFYLRLERGYVWLGIYALHAAFFPLAGFAVGVMAGGSVAAGVQLAASWFLWAVVVRTVFVLHGTWAVNSLTHIWGYRNYATRDNSRNNWLVALLAHGEGWHNNHHASPRSARHGHRWWELDMAWWVILALERVGLAKNVVRPS